MSSFFSSFQLDLLLFSLFLSLLTSTTPTPKTQTKGNPLRLALVPLRGQPLIKRHPRLHRLRGSPDSNRARGLLGEGEDGGNGRRELGLVVRAVAASAAGSPRRSQGGRRARALRRSGVSGRRHGHSRAREAPGGLRALEKRGGCVHKVEGSSQGPQARARKTKIGSFRCSLPLLLLWRLARGRRSQRRTARALRGYLPEPRARPDRGAGALDRRRALGGSGGGSQGTGISL